MKLSEVSRDILVVASFLT